MHNAHLTYATIKFISQYIRSRGDVATLHVRLVLGAFIIVFLYFLLIRQYDSKVILPSTPVVVGGKSYVFLCILPNIPLL